MQDIVHNNNAQKTKLEKYMKTNTTCKQLLSYQM